MIRGRVRIDQDRLLNQIRARLTGVASAVGLAAAEDLAVEARKNLQTGGGSTSLSGAGYGRPVRKSAGYAHVATGATLRSIQVVRSRRGSGYTHMVTVGGAAVALNYGVRPGASVDPARIEQWLAVKGLRAKPGRGGRGALARLIAQRIQRRGLAPTYFYTDAVNITRRRMAAGRYNRKGGV